MATATTSHMQNRSNSRSLSLASQGSVLPNLLHSQIVFNHVVNHLFPLPQFAQQCWREKHRTLIKNFEGEADFRNWCQHAAVTVDVRMLSVAAFLFDFGLIVHKFHNANKLRSKTIATNTWERTIEFAELDATMYILGMVFFCHFFLFETITLYPNRFTISYRLFSFYNT